MTPQTLHSNDSSVNLIDLLENMVEVFTPSYNIDAGIDGSIGVDVG